MNIITRNSRRLIYFNKFTVVMLSALFFLLSVPMGWTANQTGNTVNLGWDNSDWWSLLNPSSSLSSLCSGANVKPQEREISSSNFQILGIKLDEDLFNFNSIMAKLGKATAISRGDASTGRGQICYTSTQKKEKVYLIFEGGEVDNSFYLFTDGLNWKGSNYAVPSNLISRNLATKSGLHLGQTPAQVIAILGKPSLSHKNELYYCLHSRKKTPKEEFLRRRQEQPHMSNKEFHENYDFYDLNTTVYAKFLNGKLIYLAVSQSTTQ